MNINPHNFQTSPTPYVAKPKNDGYDELRKERAAHKRERIATRNKRIHDATSS